MFIEQANKSLTQGWRYIIGFVIIFIMGSQFIGAIPLGVVSFIKAGDIFSFEKAARENFLPLFENQKNLYLLLILLPFVVGVVIMIPVVKYLHKQRFKDLITTREKLDWKRIFFAFGLWGAFSIISTFIMYQISPDSFEWNFKLLPFLGLLAIAILIIPLQTSFEELLFRGYLMQGIGMASKTRWLPFILTSVLFGLMHAFNPEIEKLGYIVLLAYIGSGFFLGILTLMDGGMELALGYHAANNMFIALLITADWTALQTNSILLDLTEPSAFMQIILTLVTSLILIVIFAKKYKWSGWKEKLFGKIKLPLQDENDIIEGNQPL